MVFRRWLVLHFAGLILASTCYGTSSVTLSWDGSSDPLVAGYRLYWWPVLQNQTNVVDVGLATSATAIGLMPGTTYDFAVTDYDVNGLESAFSDVIPYTVPIRGATLQVALGLGSEIVLSGTAPSGYVYEVQACQSTPGSNALIWAPIGLVIANINNSFLFIDSSPPTNTSCFYRLRQTFP